METRAVTSGPVYAPEPMQAGALGIGSAEVASTGAKAAKAGSAAKASAAKASAAKAVKTTTTATKTASATAKSTSSASPSSRIVTSGPGQVTTPAKGYATTASSTTAKATTAKATTAKATTAKTTTAKATTSSASAKATGDYAFLDDAGLSAQDKLLLFLALQKKTANKELETMLDKAAAQKEAAAKSGGGLFGGATKLFDVAKFLVPALGMTDKLLGGKLDDILKQVSGPMLGAAATALGMPALAPLAMTFGPKLVGAVMDAPVAGAEKTSTSSSTSASSAKKGGELDEVELARVQMLQKRVEEWTSMISNLMQSFHQSRMNVIQNLR